jgi:hypothetical protein
MSSRLTAAFVVALLAVAGYFVHRARQNDDGFVDSDAKGTGLAISERGDAYVVTDVEGQHATIQFPDRPDLQIMPIDGVPKPMAIAKITRGDKELYFGVMRLDAATTQTMDPDTFYDLEQNGALKDSGATLDRKQAVTIDGLPAREVFAHADNETLRIRLVLDGAHGLSYMALGGAIGNDDDDIAAAQRFIESLRVAP